jgi:hypothetical protein
MTNKDIEKIKAVALKRGQTLSDAEAGTILAHIVNKQQRNVTEGIIKETLNITHFLPWGIKVGW